MNTGKAIFFGLALIAMSGGASNNAIAGAYENGVGSMEQKNYKEAAHWFKIAANNGDPIAQYKLGNMHGWLHLVYESIPPKLPPDAKLVAAFPKNLKEAAKWLSLSANQGYVDAQFLLGMAYRDGNGFTKNNVYAYKWFGLAAAREINDKRAGGIIMLREHIAEQMAPEKIYEAQMLINEWEPTTCAKP